MTNIGKTMLAFAVLLMLIAGIAILPETVSAQPNITMGNATGGNMSETNNSTGFIPWLFTNWLILLHIFYLQEAVFWDKPSILAILANEITWSVKP
jgi:hypothetical protein